MAYMSAEEKKNKILEEQSRLKKLYTKVPRRKKKLLEGLIERAAYMRITLQEYESDIDENGSVEPFTQSANCEPYDRARPVAQLYNTMNKNYQSIMKQLSDLLPEEETAKSKSKSDGFDKFVNGREDV